MYRRMIKKMQMKRENIADRGIWTAKKRYILNVWDSEGVRYEEPKKQEGDVLNLLNHLHSHLVAKC